MKEKADDKQQFIQMGTTNTNRSASKIQRQRNCSNMSPLPKNVNRILKTTCNLQHKTLDKLVRTSRSNLFITIIEKL